MTYPCFQNILTTFPHRLYNNECLCISQASVQCRKYIAGDPIHVMGGGGLAGVVGNTPLPPLKSVGHTLDPMWESW